MIERVVSGGQTGVDRAALDAAAARGVDCGGWCPKGRRAEDGKIPAVYPLKETDSRSYRVRTQRNVRDSDGTLILFTGEMRGGTALTREIALSIGKPVLSVDLDAPPVLSEVRAWLETHRVRTLNVAGPRESQQPGIGSRAKEFLTDLLSKCKHWSSGASRAAGENSSDGL